MDRASQRSGSVGRTAARTAEATGSVAVGARTIARALPRDSVADPDVIDWLARLLLVAVALDLIVTRVIVRLAIFVPKGEPWATVSSGLGRIGAATDAFVPLAGLLLLIALLMRAGRAGRRGEAALLVALAVVAAGGFALIYLPPKPVVVLVLDLLVVAIAVGSATRVRHADGPVVARVGVVVLAAAFAITAIGQTVELAETLGRSSGTFALACSTVGQLAFVGGAALVGLAGVLDMRHPVRSRGLLAAAGIATAALILLAAARAPSSFGAIAIWSVGLAAAVPVPIVAVALGLAVAGLPVLHRRAPALAIGASIVLLSGYDLAASGLVLAGLLGLVVGSSTAHRDPGLVRDPSTVP
jgi:hypothetical protein